MFIILLYFTICIVHILISQLKTVKIGFCLSIVITCSRARIYTVNGNDIVYIGVKIHEFKK